MSAPERIPLHTPVIFEGNETVVVGNDCDGWVMILVAPYMKRANGGNFISEDIAAYSGSDATIASEYAGQQGFWLNPKQIAASLQIRSTVPNGPDGCTCIHCTKFCQMAVNNLMNTVELSDVNIPPSKVKKAFACWSCRDTVAWWIAAQGWTYTG